MIAWRMLYTPHPYVNPSPPWREVAKELDEIAGVVADEDIGALIAPRGERAEHDVGAALAQCAHDLVEVGDANAHLRDAASQHLRIRVHRIAMRCRIGVRHELHLETGAGE